MTDDENSNPLSNHFNAPPNGPFQIADYSNVHTNLLNMSNFENPNSLSSHLNLSPNGPFQIADHINVHTNLLTPPVENLTINKDPGEPSSRKKPRGRPHGSKNKAKVRTEGVNKTVIQVPPTVDVLRWLGSYAEYNEVSLSVVSGGGPISEVTLQNMSSQLPEQTFVEELNLVSFSGVCTISSVRCPDIYFYNASLARSDGSVVSGTVKRMVASDQLELAIFTCTDAEFVRADDPALA